MCTPRATSTEVAFKKLQNPLPGEVLALFLAERQPTCLHALHHVLARVLCSVHGYRTDPTAAKSIPKHSLASASQLLSQKRTEPRPDSISQ